MSLMDNLSGSICHYYALPPKPSKHSTDKQVNSLQSDGSLPPCHTSSRSDFPQLCRAAQVSGENEKKNLAGYLLSLLTVGEARSIKDTVETDGVQRCL